MKYNLSITLILVSLFLLSQVVGMAFLYQDMEVVQTPAGETVAVHPETAIGERPELDKDSGESVLFVLSGVALGTILLLLIIRFAKVNLWKILFFVAVISTITIALGVFFDPTIALAVGLVLAIMKLWRPNILVHNLTELLIYSGIAVLFVPLFSILWVIILLLIISAYDAFAVWQSKHMIKMAKFQIGSNLFAGLFVRFGDKGKKGTVSTKKTAPLASAPARKKIQVREAIIGGGDIAFPLIFAGVVMESLISTLTKEMAFLKTLVIPLVLTGVLLVLLAKGEEGRFYPAMPFLTAGCLIGLAIVLLL